jgi:hypothetical protein
MPINTVRTHLHRGRKKLGERLKAKMQVRTVVMENESGRALHAAPLAVGRRV